MPVFMKPFRLASFDIAPDNKRIVFCGRSSHDENTALYILHLDTLRVELFAGGLSVDCSPAISPDNTCVLFTSTVSASDKPGALYLQRFDSGTRQRLTSTGLFDLGASFAPDMSQIAFARAARNRDYSFGGHIWDQWDVFTAGLDGSDVRQITREKYKSVGNPQWVLGTNTLIFGADALNQSNQTKGDIYTVHDKGNSAPRPLAQDTAFYSTNPSPSRRGDQIVFISDRTKPFDYEVWRMRPDGTKRVQVTRNGSYNTCPRFTTGGKQILFLSDPKRLAQPELWQVGTDGAGLRRIADSSLFDNPLGWKP